ncbi:MAG: hypothetical protein F6K31_01175 [Symploca sp. SIO2G7]|nr:hypothetical protein [Symploca sp. SIO2G7]
MLKQSNPITVACCLLPVASFHQPIFNLVQDLSESYLYPKPDQHLGFLFLFEIIEKVFYLNLQLLDLFNQNPGISKVQDQ